MADTMNSTALEGKVQEVVVVLLTSYYSTGAADVAIVEDELTDGRTSTADIDNLTVI